MSNIFTIHRQPYGEVMNPISADGVRFYDKNGDITEVRMTDGMVNIHVGGVTVSAEHLEDLIRPPSAPVGVSRYVRDARGRMMRDGKAEPQISYGTGWNACLDALEATREDAWQPIETAPKDGSDILILFDCATVPVVHIAWFRSQDEWQQSGQFAASEDETIDDYVGWWSYTRNSVTQERLVGWSAPTHWMPLPAPPKEAQQHAPVAPVGVDGLLTCYQCGKTVTWLAPDSRCGDCTRLTPDEVRG